jgi:hypothetical protein
VKIIWEGITGDGHVRRIEELDGYIPGCGTGSIGSGFQYLKVDRCCEDNSGGDKRICEMGQIYALDTSRVDSRLI